MLTSIRLRNFKSFEDVSFQLSPLTLIYGANGVGKSNLVDALRFLKAVGQGISIRDAIEGHSTLVSPGLAVPGLRGGSSELTRFGSKSRRFGIVVDLRRNGTNFRYEIRVDAESYKVVKEELKSPKHPGGYVFSTHPEGAPIEQSMDSPALVARFYKATPGRNPRRSFSAYESVLSQFSGRKAETLLNESVANEVRAELSAITPLELRPEVLRQYSSLGRFDLGEHGENFAAAVWLLQSFSQREDDLGKDAISRLEAITSWLEQLTPRSIQGVATERAPTGEVIFSVNEGSSDRPISARSLSDGTLRFAAIAFTLFGTMYPLGGPGKILVIEELENGINPARLALLLKMIEAATRQRENTQVIATTHAPSILDMASKETFAGVLVVGWDAEKDSSRVVRLAELPDIDRLKSETSLSELLSEGWLQLAADA